MEYPDCLFLRLWVVLSTFITTAQTSSIAHCLVVEFTVMMDAATKLTTTIEWKYNTHGALGLIKYKVIEIDHLRGYCCTEYRFPRPYMALKGEGGNTEECEHDKMQLPTSL